MSTPVQPGGGARSQWFATTHWSVVLAAGQESDTRAEAAIETLCRTYWPPLYAYVRQQGHRPEDAQDLTQAFFAHCLERHSFVRASPEQGRFRTFLLSSLKHFLVDEWRKTVARKRRGAAPSVSWDASEAEQSYAAELPSPLTPEQLYDKRWALTLIERALARLREEHSAPKERKLFERVGDYVWGEKGDISYGQVAEELGLSEGALRVSVHRMRRRCGELLRQEVAQTVGRPEDIEDELRHLVGVWSG